MAGSVQMIDSAMAGLNRATKRLEKSAARIARLPDLGVKSDDEVNLSEEIVNLLFAKRSYEANLKAIETANEIRDHAIDVLG